MPTLAQSLEGQDFGHCQIVAESWGIELHAKDMREAIQQLSQELPKQVSAQWEKLSERERGAISEIVVKSGKLPWIQFTRDFGEIREMGAGKRDKERPQHHPISTAETLWYRAVIGRAFLDTAQGLQEFAFIPDELMTSVPQQRIGSKEILGRPARPEERAQEIPANDHILDEACTLLAGLRVGLSEEELLSAEDWRMPISVLKMLLIAAKILDGSGRPLPEPTRKFLEADRGKALSLLIKAWLQSSAFNDLRLIPGLIAEGTWVNDAIAARQKVIEFAQSAPPNQWWSISALIADVKVKHTDFQRPAGDYESWYLLKSDTGEYLRGFDHWDEVDGALIAFLIQGPLHWLGFVDMAAPASGQRATAFRCSRWADALSSGEVPAGLKVEGLRLKVDSHGIVFVPQLAPRTIRYVVSRFTDWLPKQKDVYRYQISAQALERAGKQGLEARQLLGLLKTYSASALPPNLISAIKRWEQQGTQTRIEKLEVLRVNSVGALKALRSSRAARYLGEPLGPTSIAIKPGAGQQVLQALIELGYLGTLDVE